MTTSVAGAADKRITIYIDGTPHPARAGMTPVSQLRKLPSLEVPADKQIWLDIDGAQDQRLDEHATIDLVDGMRFFTEIPGITIRIDRESFEVFERKLTGAGLRVLPSPDVAPDRDLWRDVPDKRDIKVQDEDVVELTDGMRFFTAPGRINPGSEK